MTGLSTKTLRKVKERSVFVTNEICKINMYPWMPIKKLLGKQILNEQMRRQRQRDTFIMEYEKRLDELEAKASRYDAQERASGRKISPKQSLSPLGESGYLNETSNRTEREKDEE